MNNNSRNMKKREITSGKFLKLYEISYLDKKSKVRNWEAVERVNSYGAAIIIAKLQPSNRIILVEQYRPPANNYVLEFPAGLIDEGETALQSAIRELKEETGYIGQKCDNVSMPLYSSPGVTGEKITFVELEVDELNHGEVIQALEPSEDLEVHLIPEIELYDFLVKKAEKNIAIDAKLYAYSLSKKRI